MRGGNYVAPDAEPRARCPEHGSYNPYRHARCPVCHTEDGGWYLGCDECGYDWLADSEVIDGACPRCGADARAVATLRSPEV